MFSYTYDMMPMVIKEIPMANSIMYGKARQLPFWERVNLQIEIDENGCHIFTGCKDECGYGRVRDTRFQSKLNKNIRLHRAMWEKHHGEISLGMVVCHSCDVPACINPDHLFIGHQSDNIKDMDKKGRRKTLVGSEQGGAKLNEQMIPLIRQLLNKGNTCKSIAMIFKVSEGMIRHIKKGRAWKHVP